MIGGFTEGILMAPIVAPRASRAILQRRGELVAMLHGLVPLGRVLHETEGRHAYEGDASSAHRSLPLAVVMPASTREVSGVLRYCYEVGIKVYPRGAGTSLTGGAVGREDGIVLCFSRMNRILDVDIANRQVRAEAGATNSQISAAVAARGLMFAPDPASRAVATIAGNIATDAGGACAMAYGPTSRHVLALTVVLVNGEIVELGGGELESSGYDLAGLLFGAEGTLGVVVEAVVGVVPRPEQRALTLLGFPTVAGAIACAEGLRASDARLTALELMDNRVVTVCEDFAGAGLPTDVEALLIVAYEGDADEIKRQADLIHHAAVAHAPIHQSVRNGNAAIDAVWRATDGALAALGRFGQVHCIDIAVPPARLAEAIAAIAEIASRHGLRGANLCRAGEGIIRAVLLYDAEQPQEVERIDAAMSEVAGITTSLGGGLAGEHGIGIAKRDIVSLPDIELHRRLKSTFDAEWLLNDGKVYPIAGDGPTA